MVDRGWGRVGGVRRVGRGRGSHSGAGVVGRRLRRDGGERSGRRRGDGGGGRRRRGGRRGSERLSDGRDVLQRSLRGSQEGSRQLRVVRKQVRRDAVQRGQVRSHEPARGPGRLHGRHSRGGHRSHRGVRLRVVSGRADHAERCWGDAVHQPDGVQGEGPSARPHRTRTGRRDPRSGGAFPDPCMGRWGRRVEQRHRGRCRVPRVEARNSGLRRRVRLSRLRHQPRAFGWDFRGDVLRDGQGCDDGRGRQVHLRGRRKRGGRSRTNAARIAARPSWGRGETRSAWPCVREACSSCTRDWPATRVGMSPS